jgi:hypothetical protein
MSYPKDLDEYTDAQIEKEFRRRQECKEKGLCSYCCQPITTHNCKVAANLDIQNGLTRQFNDVNDLIDSLKRPWEE